MMCFHGVAQITSPEFTLNRIRASLALEKLVQFKLLPSSLTFAFGEVEQVPHM